ncbi:ead/Ea22-like family protein [Enterobacter roggenkampii]|uniref:ead/Ea22-like family protein n=1 Tax=Enterobacter roggenkampii TaxID=1812935 RepID=UPI0021691955|nr:ead/Ea22-like family protein [Enterobacter roggenkampii]
MSNIDKQALREAAEKATKGQWAVEFDDEIYSTDGVNNEQIAMVFSENEVRDAAFIAAANPATVLALLDELEAKDRKILKLEKLAEAESVGADKAATSGVEWMKLYHAAEKRIAELERKEQHSERQSVIDALAGSGEEWSDIEEYMQKWDAERASAAGKGE